MISPQKQIQVFIAEAAIAKRPKTTKLKMRIVKRLLFSRSFGGRGFVAGVALGQAAPFGLRKICRRAIDTGLLEDLLGSFVTGQMSTARMRQHSAKL